MSETRTYTREDADAMLGAMPATSAGQAAACPEGFTVHTLQTGETLRSVAQAYGLTLNELMLYNPSINPYYYRTGDSICVPAGGSISQNGMSANGSTDMIIEDFGTSNGSMNGTSNGSMNGSMNGSSNGSMNGMTNGSMNGAANGSMNGMTNGGTDQTPAAPGEGTEELPTPALPNGTPASPEEGPEELPTPSLPGNGQNGGAPIPTCTNGRYYRVVSGDTLRNIANRFGITLSSLMQANPGITNNRLLVGQLLCIPACCQNVVCVTRVRVPSGASFADFLTRYDVSFASMAAANPGVNLLSLRAGQVLCVPPTGSRGLCSSNGTEYLMQAGETLSTLAEANNTSVAELLLANPNLAPSDFTMGRLVCVPNPT